MRITNFHVLLGLILMVGGCQLSYFLNDSSAPLLASSGESSVIGKALSPSRTSPAQRRAKNLLDEASAFLDHSIETGRDTTVSSQVYYEALKAYKRAKDDGDFERVASLLRQVTEEPLVLTEKTIRRKKIDPSLSPQFLDEEPKRTIKRTRFRKKLTSSSNRRKKSKGSRSRYKRYRIRRGDTLWSIAKKRNVYGQGNQWVKIWRANQKKIPNFDVIPVGTFLKIPQT